MISQALDRLNLGQSLGKRLSQKLDQHILDLARKKKITDRTLKTYLAINQKSSLKSFLQNLNKTLTQTQTTKEDIVKKTVKQTKKNAPKPFPASTVNQKSSLKSFLQNLNKTLTQTTKEDITQKTVRQTKKNAPKPFPASTVNRNKVEKEWRNAYRFKNVAEIVEFYNTEGGKDILTYKERMRSIIQGEMIDYLKRNGSYKITISILVDMKKPSNQGTPNEGNVYPMIISSGKNTQNSSQNTAKIILSKNDIPKTYEIMFSRIIEIVEDRIEAESGFVVFKIIGANVRFSNYTPYIGASYIDLPTHIKNKKCCINVKNEDNKCFMWAILSAIHPVKKDAQRVSKYREYENELNFTDITFPVDATHYERFEQLNNIPINVWGIDEDGDKVLEYGHKINSHNNIVNLLRFEDDTKSHYCWIHRFNAFMNNGKGNDEHFNCDRCHRRFRRKEAYDNHFAKNQCVESTDGIIKELPEEGKHYCQFKNYDKMLEAPFVIYADCESILKPIDKNVGENSKAYQHHQCWNVGCRLVSRYPDILNDTYKQWDGEDAMDMFLEYCLKIGSHIKNDILKENVEMVMTEADCVNFENAKECFLCRKQLNGDKVRDHNHLTGQYRGAAHSSCNIQFNYRRYKLPVIFHNLRGYDSHLIISAAGKCNKNISVIPNTMEKYLSFDIGCLRFLDSLQFTLCSLDKLVAGLNKAGDENNFPVFNEEFNGADEFKKLLRQKGIFPYDWYDGADKLACEKLPKKEDFYSQLAEDDIKEEDYERAKLVWNKAGCKTFYDYLSIYLKCDVCLLADCFEAFRNMCLKNYRLDPVHYYTSPGFSWDAMLLRSGVKIECFYEGQYDMLEMMQNGMRGGMSMITNRYAEANNKYLSDYNPKLPSSYIIYLDANNLYGWAMSQKLPIGEYEWNNDTWETENILRLNDDANYGYIFEVDLDIPIEKHDYFNDYPLCPENTHFGASPKMLELAEILNMKDAKTNKLIPNLKNKKNYVIHYRNLKQALQLGYQLVKVHRVLQFKQEAYLADYIDFNTSQRAKCKNDYEKDLFKLMNNSIFGKTCENVNNRIDVAFYTTAEQFKKQSTKHHFKDFRIFSNELVAVEKYKTKITYNRPIITGFAVLELSKVLMYNFHYKNIKEKYANKAKLLFTDTDSLTYKIETEDIYDDMLKNKEDFDFCDYPSNHLIFNGMSEEQINAIKNMNKKVIGKFKDETEAKPVKEFVGLRAKMYSLLLDNGKNKKTAKGVKKNKINGITHDEYKSCIFGREREELQKFVRFNTIQSKNHQLYTYQINKVSLCAFDDKRYVCDNNIDTLSHGHFKIKY